jgi:hypothetical protein
MNERDKAICDRYKSGLAMTEIGRRFGMTRTRVQQIIRAENKPSSRFDGVVVSVRPRNVLHNAGFETWHDVRNAGYSDVMWLRHPNLGRGTLNELHSVLGRLPSPFDFSEFEWTPSSKRIPEIGAELGGCVE